MSTCLCHRDNSTCAVTGKEGIYKFMCVYISTYTDIIKINFRHRLACVRVRVSHTCIFTHWVCDSTVDVGTSFMPSTMTQTPLRSLS